MVKAGLKAIYLSGWQVAADANLAGQVYPDQSLYPADSAPNLVRNINNAFRGPIRSSTGGQERHLLVCAHRGRRRGRFRRPAQRLRADEGDDRGRCRGRTLRGPAVVGEEVRPHGRQSAGANRAAVHKLVAARLAMDVMDVPTILVARTDANGATLMTSDVDPTTAPSRPASAHLTASFVPRRREGGDRSRAAYAPYADIVWCETAEPNLDGGTRVRRRIH